mmetsp:Transcript_6974/g.9365  ORF Transcript_6974/g.9365 Transcript_6974/m.9365 type:complete len:256 (-) Transcript_6974:168-935(-)|eukprot:CAMPEP_0117791578 /NCGR_PEP_ID=MMETSP0948-20121206/8933_1 /TAXON_ID=44440 /ORGANISM="Chattonella subsalsa, Strain CCMP2191" /LENGTH=255 /DNA_ID=CAMNT_0005621643 /DNA_START=35 /DNA_END=802 /DNA_ORIENTATION=+
MQSHEENCKCCLCRHIRGEERKPFGNIPCKDFLMPHGCSRAECKFGHFEADQIPACKFGKKCNFGPSRCAFDHFKTLDHTEESKNSYLPNMDQNSGRELAVIASLRGEIAALKSIILDLQQENTDLKKDTTPIELSPPHVFHGEENADSKLDLASIDPPSDSKEEQVEVHSEVDQTDLSNKIDLFEVVIAWDDESYKCGMCTGKIDKPGTKYYKSCCQKLCQMVDDNSPCCKKDKIFCIDCTQAQVTRWISGCAV